MSIEAIRQVTETEQANKQSRAAAEAEARQLVLDAERNGTELLKQVRSDAAEQGKDLLRRRRNGRRCGPRRSRGGGGGEPGASASRRNSIWMRPPSLL